MWETGISQCRTAFACIPASDIFYPSHILITPPYMYIVPSKTWFSHDQYFVHPPDCQETIFFAVGDGV